MAARNMHDRYEQDDMSAHFTRSQELPDAVAEEQALLGAALVQNDAMDAIPATFDAEFFGEDIHRKIFRAMMELRDMGKSFNPVTIKMKLNDVELVKGVTVSQYLARLASEAVNLVNMPDFAFAVTEASVRRDMASLANGVQIAAYDRELSLIDEIDAVASRLSELQMRLTGGDSIGVTGQEAFVTAICQSERAMSGSEDAGIDCGLEPVRQLIGKLMPGHLIVIGGATKQGKSALARQLGMGAMRDGAAVLDYSGEMDSPELARRELARISKVSATQQMMGKLSHEELQAVRQAQAELSRMEWHIIDRRRTIEKLCREFEAFAKRHRRAVLIVDSVTLFETDRDTRRMEKFQFAEYATDRLKALARKTGCPVIALSQLKKNTFAVERAYNKAPTVKTYRNVVARRPKASDLYGSCERDADHVLIPFNPMPILEDIEPAEGSDEHIFWEEVVREYKGHAEIILAISRHQAPSRRTVEWVGEITSFLPTSRSQYEQTRFF